MKRYLILILFLFLLTSCSKKSENVLISPRNTFEFNEKIKLTSIFTNEDIFLPDKYLKTSKLGKHTIAIYYKKNNKVYKENFTYEIKDTKAPICDVINEIQIALGSEEDLSSFVNCFDEYDTKPVININGSYDTSIVDKYPLELETKDKNGNISKYPIILNVMPKAGKGSSENIGERTTMEEIKEKYKTKDTMLGIDVSLYQQKINWQKVKEDGVEFAMIRLGYQSTFDDDNYSLDAYFKYNIEKAKEYGIKVGVYFYSYAKDEKEARKQAQFVIENLKEYSLDLPVVFDWENFAKWDSIGITLFDLKAIGNAFMAEIEKNGYKAMRYGSKSHLLEYWGKESDYPTWLAHYRNSKSDYKYDYVMWQLCNNGLVNGINGSVDLNVYFGNN